MRVVSETGRSDVTWLQLDDNMPEHPKIADLSAEAFRLHLRGLAYCARLLTDGKVPETIAQSFANSSPTPRETLDELRVKRLWKKRRNGYEIAQYLDWNPSRADVEARREAKKAGGRKGAARRWNTDGSTHGMTHRSTNGRTHGEKDAPLPSPSSYEVHQEDLGEEAEHNTAEAIHRLLDACGQERGQHAHLELMSMMAQGATAWDFDTARSATLKARPKHPWKYARVALRNRLANKEPAA